MQKKKIALLGSTGSIGTQTLEVCDITNEYEVSALTSHKNVKLIENQIRKYKPKYACMSDEGAANDLKVRVSDTNTKVLSGVEGVCQCAALDEIDIAVTAIVGIAGLRPTVSAINAKKTIALANKETLVTAGSIIMGLAQSNGVRIIPVDSEHSAIFQAIANQRDFLKRIIITASGGPFFGKSPSELMGITPQMALRHPNWSMGSKITVDSATLVNKGLEIIEAMHLFGVSHRQITPVIHRESIVHSMVEFCDGSVIAQMGVPDMKLPISYALSYPKRTVPVTEPLDLVKIGKLSFYDVDNGTFPAIELARRAADAGGVMCAIFNGANEAAVEMFLKEKCSFTDITKFIAKAMEKAPKLDNPTLEDIFEADLLARKLVKECD